MVLSDCLTCPLLSILKWNSPEPLRDMNGRLIPSASQPWGWGRGYKNYHISVSLTCPLLSILKWNGLEPLKDMNGRLIPSASQPREREEGIGKLWYIRLSYLSPVVHFEVEQP